LSDKLARRLAERQQRPELTQREMEVLQMLIKGRTNKEIGRASSLCEDTVKAHSKTLFEKLKVQDRTEAAIHAIRHGIVHLEQLIQTAPRHFAKKRLPVHKRGLPACFRPCVLR
jgi:DNA-binding CsgD family transcriptional regulator